MESFERPSPESDDQALRVYQAAYHDFLNGLFLHDISQLREAGNQLTDSGFPYVRSIAAYGRQLEDLWLSNEGQAIKAKNITEKLLASTLQSYVYSGVPVDCDYVFFISTVFDKSRRWLYSTLEPNRVALRDIFQDRVLSSTQFRAKRESGFQVMEQLNIIHAFGKMIAIIS